jgi:hypothetical protein
VGHAELEDAVVIAAKAYYEARAAYSKTFYAQRTSVLVNKVSRAELQLQQAVKSLIAFESKPATASASGQQP